MLRLALTSYRCLLLCRCVPCRSAKQWWKLTEQMVLTPLYYDASGNLQEAPGGYDINRPGEFIRAHPKMVALSVLALKLTIKVAAAAGGICLGAPAVEMMIPDMGEAVGEMGMSVGSTLAGKVTAPGGEEEREALSQVANEMTIGDYKKLASWLKDKYGEGWESMSGLTVREEKNGRHQYVPEVQTIVAGQSVTPDDGEVVSDPSALDPEQVVVTTAPPPPEEKLCGCCALL